MEIKINSLLTFVSEPQISFLFTAHLSKGLTLSFGFITILPRLRDINFYNHFINLHFCSRLCHLPCPCPPWWSQEACTKGLHIRQTPLSWSQPTEVPAFSQECCRGNEHCLRQHMHNELISSFNTVHHLLSGINVHCVEF